MIKFTAKLQNREPKLRILQLVYAFYPPYSESGNSRVAYEISEGLVRMGHYVTVCTTNILAGEKMFDPKKKVHNINGIKVHYHKNLIYKPHARVPLFYSQGVVNEIKKDIPNYDVIHLHENRFYISILLHHYAKKHGIPYVLQAHGDLPRIAKRSLKMLFDTFFGYRLLRDASKVIALSETEAEQYKSMGVSDEKIVVIPNGIDLSEYADLPPKSSFKAQFGIDDGKRIILYLGRINKAKGIDFLIEAFGYMTKNKKRDDTILVIAGPDDGYLNRVKWLSDDLGLNNKVVFTGGLLPKEKVCAYVDSEIVVNVEPRNVFGLVPLEAAACSRPVVVSASNAISEVVQKGKFGFSVKYGDVIGLAGTIDDMLRNDDLRTTMGQKGRKFVFENCDWAGIVSKLEETYEAIVKRKPGAMQKPCNRRF